MKPRYGRRDANEPELVRCLEPLGGLWVPAGPFDGWAWDRFRWHLCEIKDPRKEGWKDEFTPEQILLLAKLNPRGIPVRVLRTEADVLALMGARRSA